MHSHRVDHMRSPVRMYQRQQACNREHQEASYMGYGANMDVFIQQAKHVQAGSGHVQTKGTRR